MNRVSPWLGATSLALALAIAGACGPAAAQTRPTSTPTYIPTGDLAVQAMSAIGASTPYVIQNEGTVAVQLTGTYTGLAGTVQGTETAVGTPTWVNLTAEPTGSGLGASFLASLSGNGIYRYNTAGYRQVRFNLTAISTGAVNVKMTGGGPSYQTSGTLRRRASYSAAITGLTTAASATDFLVLSGSATTTVRVTHAECSGIATTAGYATIQALTHTVADTGTVNTTLTDVPHDTSDPAGTAVAVSYTANPTVTAGAGLVRSGRVALPLVTAPTPGPEIWEFDAALQGEPITLRGVAQQFALNGSGATLATGASLNCSIEWTEE